MGITNQKCSPEAVVRLKKNCRACVSYTSIVKRLERFRILRACRLQQDAGYKGGGTVVRCANLQARVFQASASMKERFEDEAGKRILRTRLESFR